MGGSFKAKVAVVTGAASGIGRATALTYARKEAKVVVADVNAEAGEQTVSLITEASGEAIFVPTDVSKAGDVEAMVNRAIESYGRLDYAHNNAGIRSIGVNLKGIWLSMKYEIPRMLEHGGGVIVNTSAGSGLVGFPGASAYVAAKHGVIGLTKAAALEYAKQGVRVNAVCPGYVGTPMIEGPLKDPEWVTRAIFRQPVGRIGTPAEVAECVMWLCSDAASFVTGHAMAVDGGYTAQ